MKWKNKQFIFLFFGLFLSSLFLTGTAKATILLQEDFEDNTIGNLIGQSINGTTWTGNASYDGTVVTSTEIMTGVNVYSGKSAALGRDSQIDCASCFTTSNTGYLEAFFTVPEIHQPDKNQISFYLFDQDLGSYALIQTQNGDVQIYNNGSWVSLGYSLSENVWYQIKINWDLTNHQYRLKVTGQGDWSSWYTINSAQNEVDGTRISVSSNGLVGNLRNGVDNLCISTTESECVFETNAPLEIDLISPPDFSIVSSTLNPNFTNWVVEILNINSSTEPFTYGVEYDYRSSSTFGFSTSRIYPSFQPLIQNHYVIPRDRSQPFLNYSDHWYARAWLLQGTSTFSYSSVIDFYVSSTYSQPPSDWFLPSNPQSLAGWKDTNYIAPTQSECENKWIMCLNDKGLTTSTNPWLHPDYYSCVVADLIRNFSYCGAEDAEVYLADQFSKLTKSFPFSVVLGTIDDFSTSSADIASASSLSLDMGSTLGTLEFANASTFPETLGSDNFIKLQNFLGNILKAGSFMIMLFALL